jgi:hypothetical protein
MRSNFYFIFEKCNHGTFTIIDKKEANYLFFKYKNDQEKLQKMNKDEIGELHVDEETMCLKDFPNTLIHIENLFDTTIDCIDKYYVCNGCGHIYW